MQAASEAEAWIRRAGQWFAWKWVAMAVGAAAGVCLVAYAALAWQLHQIGSLRAEKAALEVDVAQMHVNAAALAKKGGRIVMTTCGGRLCIEGSSNQGTDADGNEGGLGSWHTNDGRNITLVIPRGY